MKRQKHKESKRKNGLIKEIVLFLLLKQSCPIPIEEKAISYRMTDKQGIPFIVKIKNKEMNHTKKAVPACREASKPLFEERSDAVKVSETLCLG